MAYLSEQSLQEMRFKSIGKNVKISDKASIYDADKIEIGDNSRIDDFCVVSGKVSIANFVHIAPFCLLAGGEKGIFMEDFSGLAYAGHIFSQSDDYSGESLTNPMIPAQYKFQKKAAVTIKKHVIIGARSMVFPGVTVAEGCSVGAMSLVTKDTQPWGVYVGIPARRLKERKKDLLQFEKEFLANL